MTSWVFVLDGQVMGIVDDDTCSLGSCVIFRQTAVVVVKDSVRS